MLNNYLELKEKLLEELREVLGKVSTEEVDRLLEELTKPRKVFVVGTGRSMFMMQALAKRLKHLGLDSYVVGETTVPPLKQGDLLIAGSASGETMTTLNIAKIGKKLGGSLTVFTANACSSLAHLADICILIPAPGAWDKKAESSFLQPAANLFEESLFLLCDILCILLKKRLGVSDEDMLKRHANLE